MDKLDDAERKGLADALDDEFKSRETYAQVIRDFGDVRPFINIVDAERRHADALLGLFAKYEISPPANRWKGQTFRFSTLHEACVASVQGEIENVAVYDRVMSTTNRPDILAVYQSLRDASLDRHLPAFRRCADREKR